MPSFPFSALTWAFLFLGIAVSTVTPSGAFENPDSRSRPRFRYWLPDASVDGNVVSADIKSAGDIGAGGVEFLPFYNYGGDHGPQPEGADWSTFAFGTPAYRDLLIDALRAHKESGLFMDIAIGPNQGQGVPARPDDEGLQWDLIPYTSEVPVNGSFTGLIPGWNAKDGELLAVISARVISQKDDWRGGQGFDGVWNATWTEYTVDHGSLTDVTEHVDRSSGLFTQFFDADKGHYRLFAFYQRLSGHHNVHFDNDRRETIFDYGSFAVDHNDARGAKTVIKLWEEHILDDEVLSLIKEAGNYMWEDSIEVIANTTWSPSLPERFEKRFDYSLLPYLPLLAWGHNNIAMQVKDPGHIKVVLDTAHAGAGYINDFRVILTEGYVDYLQTLRDWADERLGIQFSTQPSYGFPQDMAVSVPVPDAPECESLSFHDSIDAYRQFAGPAQLAGKNIISNEVGAVALRAYSYELKELVWSVNRAVAGGINQFIIHGQSYSGDYFGTTWPGYTAFLYLFSELYSNKQPSWDHGLADVLEYMSRLQFVQRQGKPRVDVAILNKQSSNNPDFPEVYPDEDLQAEGWTYTYLTDLNLDLPEAVVENGVLAPDSPAWKAFVIEASQNITVDTIKRVEKLAEAGLPVIIAGSPGYYPTRSTCSRSRFERALASLRKVENVYSVAPGEVAAQLGKLGLYPRIKTAHSQWYTTWRTDKNTGVDYALFFNDGNATSGEAVIATTKKPYLLDPWTGERSEVAHYAKSDESITIPLDFAKDQIKIIAFEDGDTSCHIVSAPSEAALSKKASTVIAHAPASAYGSVELSSGKHAALTSSAAEGFILSDWSLTVSHWTAPSDLYDASTIATKRNTTHRINSPLPSWTSIEGLEDTSGVGYYNSTFTWSKGDGDGAYISFPPVDHALTVFINGERIPALDHARPVGDISAFLKEGENDVLAVVPSTMWNYLRTIMGDLRSGGEKSSLITRLGGRLPGRVDNGIRGVVEVTPFVAIDVGC